MVPGTFVTVSGVDGGGKSTLVERLAARAEGHWSEVITLAPLKGDPVLVRQVRSLPAPGEGDWRAREQWMAGYFSLRLAIAARADVEPALARGSLVIADRWCSDHVVNQSYFGADLAEWQPLLDSLPKPDLAIWLDVPPATARERIASRRDAGIGGNDSFLRFAAVRFGEVMSSVPHVRVDGRIPTDEAVRTILEHLLPATQRGGP